MIWEPPSEMSELKAASGPVGLVLNLSIYWNIEKQGVCLSRGGVYFPALLF